MILTQLLGFASDLLVSGLVKTTTVPSRCPFGTGIVVPLKPVTWRSNPSLNQNATRIVMQARVTSKANGGLTGIYWKVNADPNFRADSQDVIGNWICVDMQNDTVYPANLTLSPQNVLDDLANRGLMYHGSSATAGNIPNSGWNTFIGWGASVANNVAKPWTARVSGDMTNFSGNESNYNPRLIKMFDCHLNASSIEWILTFMDGDTTMQQWNLALQDRVFGGRSADIPYNIAAMLETMTQVGWGGDVGTNDTATVNPTQGCLSPRALIPFPVCILLLITTLSLAAMISYWSALFVLVRSAAASFSKLGATRVDEYTPNGLVGWMTQAVREHGTDGDFKAKDLGRRAVILSDDGRLAIQ
jgi:hypothetical protein